MGSIDNRNFERFPLSRLAFVQSTETMETYGGVLLNISVNGAMVQLTFPMKEVSDSFDKGCVVDVTIDEFPPLKGSVVRATVESIAVTFTMDSENQTSLMSEIMSAMEHEPGQPFI
ncbi:MAG: PilZ domain-containing protein [Rhodospirillales bacterium]|jgi:hypothetical protein|nr:PilZ domain-containing protein [Rhodospirillales bacterium]MBT4041577.1 PilZ domain-containing protein [Rhodospirillales bacterium]MBT4627662.1 PilZ domain-containing protein [Rhodospirillales bacterium]MBT5352899.1 PilZ domain-containing protein [Rhodospirillales bacterium]MBT5519153.1 PilZ domain-containing protein [Rhodospirillales bacterium]